MGTIYTTLINIRLACLGVKRLLLAESRNLACYAGSRRPTPAARKMLKDRIDDITRGMANQDPGLQASGQLSRLKTCLAADVAAF